MLMLSQSAFAASSFASRKQQQQSRAGLQQQPQQQQQKRGKSSTDVARTRSYWERVCRLQRTVVCKRDALRQKLDESERQAIEHYQACNTLAEKYLRLIQTPGAVAALPWWEVADMYHDACDAAQRALVSIERMWDVEDDAQFIDNAARSQFWYEGVLAVKANLMRHSVAKVL